MNKLSIESTYYTPRIELNPESGTLELEGRILETITENNEDIFAKISNWIQMYFLEKKAPLIIKFRLSYYNTTSSKRMVKFIRNVEDLFQKGHDIKIVWEYEDGDEDALMDGEVFKKLFSVPFDVARI